MAEQNQDEAAVKEEAVVNEEIKDNAASLTEDQKEIVKLKETIDSLKADLDNEKEKNKSASEKLEEAVKAAEKLSSDLQEAKSSLALKDADLVKEKNLRESLENELIEKNKTLRESLEDKFLSLRERLGKGVLVQEELSKRSDESLRDAINDLKEEFEKKNAANLIEHTVNPGIVDDEAINEDSKKSISTSESFEDTPKLQEQLENLLYAMMKK